MSDSDSQAYPVRLSVEYPDGARNRPSIFVRIILAIPIAIIGVLVTGSSQLGQADASWNLGRTEALVATAGLFLATTALMILFRQKYPRWWFDWNLEVARFITRINAYLLLLRDDYPSTDERQAVTVDIEYPGCEDRSEPRASAVQVVPRNPPLHRPERSGNRGCGGDRARLVRDPDHGRTAKVDVPVSGRADALQPPGHRLRVPADDGPLSAVSTGRVGAACVWCRADWVGIAYESTSAPHADD